MRSSRLASIVLAMATLFGAAASAQPEDGAAPAAGLAAPAGSERGSVRHLAALCAATSENPRREAAIGLCYGFMIGVGQFHAAIHPVGSTRPPLFCLPDPPPTLETVAAGFVAWSQANPQHAQERAVEGVARWAGAAFPCPAAPAPERGRRTR
jgi:hypothetical protein